MLPPIYEHVTHLLNLDETAQDSFPDGSPLGVTIHYTGSPNVPGAVKSLIQQSLGYHILIERDGSVYQMTSFNRKCWHAGKALWLGRAPNHHHVAVSLSSWGYVVQAGENFKSYSGFIIPKEEVAYREDNATGKILYWHEASVPQLASLQTLLHWFVDRGIDPDNVCGHDECSIPPGRKSDPGGILPFRMTELRKMLKGYQKSLSLT